MLTEFKRVKHGELPGDISRRHLIAMREKRVPFRVYYGGGHFQQIGIKCAKVFRKNLTKKSRTVQRRRDKKEIESQVGL